MQQAARLIGLGVAGGRSVRDDHVVKLKPLDRAHVCHVHTGGKAEVAIVDEASSGHFFAECMESFGCLGRAENDANRGLRFALGKLAQRFDKEEVGLRLVREVESAHGQAIATSLSHLLGRERSEDGARQLGNRLGATIGNLQTTTRRATGTERLQGVVPTGKTGKRLYTRQNLLFVYKLFNFK